MFQKMKREIMKEIKKISAIALASIYAVAVSALSLYIYQKLHSVGLCGAHALCVLDIPLYYFVPVIASSGFLIGALMFYLISEKEKEMEEYKHHESEKINELLEKVLTKSEKDVLDAIPKGRWIHQAEISKKLDMSRVEVFRVIKKLTEKELIEKEKVGKVVKLRKNL